MPQSNKLSVAEPSPEDRAVARGLAVIWPAPEQMELEDSALVEGVSLAIRAAVRPLLTG